MLGGEVVEWMMSRKKEDGWRVGWPRFKYLGDWITLATDLVLGGYGPLIDLGGGRVPAVFGSNFCCPFARDLGHLFRWSKWPQFWWQFCACLDSKWGSTYTPQFRLAAAKIWSNATS